MVKIRDFQALRPREDLADEVASPPYDVLDSREARQRARGKPYSFLHVVKPEIDLPEETDPYDGSVYLKGRENLDRMAADGVLIDDEEPGLYFYRQVMGDHSQTGLVACASIEDYENDRIKKHEHTRADKEADRIRHVETLNANTGPVFLTYPADREMNRLAEEIASTPPLYDFTADDGIRHTVWKVTGADRTEKIKGIFARLDRLYVADGHHRSASGVRVGQKRREANPTHTGAEEYNFFLAVLFPHDQLKIMDYNRVVKDLAGLSPEEFLKRIGGGFGVEPSPGNQPFRPAARHEFGMYLAGKWYQLTARPGSFPKDDPVKSLDVSILQENLLAPILKIGDPRKDKRIDFVGGIRGLGELARRVDGGEAVAFALYPTSIEQLMAIADAGLIMPPKSTWFEPKLRSGLLIHRLD
ncbi:MAG: DUF1015 family protein [Candidatus Erginobacter occultus]|nr:DUF1015 family protein [Candidatus Erginobacter occultus]